MTVTKRKELIAAVDLGGSKITAVLADAGANVKALGDQGSYADHGPDQAIRAHHRVHFQNSTVRVTVSWGFESSAGQQELNMLAPDREQQPGF